MKNSSADEEKGSIIFGDFIKSRRRKHRITLREFCERTRTNSSFFSKLERGLAPPPEDQRQLNEWADVLKLEEDSPKREMFFKLAKMSYEPVDHPAVTDDKELAKVMPLLVYDSEGKPLNDSQLDKLKELVRDSYRAEK